VLQAVKARITRADYVACPSCGRTLFDLMEVTAHIKEVTNHLDGVTIAIMGCIVNGPGEMADADFGFVGSGPGKVDLYRGKEKVRTGIPFAGARDELVGLIKDAGKWKDPGA
jgi:(E)-4-hydroxy-3-methylbut-2-enyl-diphosphate synthase